MEAVNLTRRATTQLNRWNFTVTARPDGLFDIVNYGEGCDIEEVLDLWLWMSIWPSAPRWKHQSAPAAQWLCGG